MASYQYRKSHCGDKTVVRSSYLHNGISYTGKMPSEFILNQPPDSNKVKSSGNTMKWSNCWNKKKKNIYQHYQNMAQGARNPNGSYGLQVWCNGRLIIRQWKNNHRQRTRHTNDVMFRFSGIFLNGIFFYVLGNTIEKSAPKWKD